MISPIESYERAMEAAAEVPDRDSWTTPLKLFQWLDVGHDFTLDAAAAKENALCKRFFTKEDDALKQTWTGSVFCNPPYSMAREFSEKATAEFKNYNDCVLLLPVRSDRVWFQQMLNSPLWDHTWITGRVHFGNSGKGAFMYSILFFANTGAPRGHCRWVDASQFNEGGKGGARS